MNVRGISQGPRCEPATNSTVDSRSTGSTGIHMETVLEAVDVVVRLVLVPRRRLARAGLLDEQVVVEEPDLPRAHQLAGDRGRGRLRGRTPRTPGSAASCRSPRRSGPGRPAGARRAPARSARRGCARSPARRARPRSAENAPRTQTAPSRRKSSCRLIRSPAGSGRAGRGRSAFHVHQPSVVRAVVRVLPVLQVGVDVVLVRGARHVRAHRGVEAAEPGQRRRLVLGAPQYARYCIEQSGSRWTKAVAAGRHAGDRAAVRVHDQRARAVAEDCRASMPCCERRDRAGRERLRRRSRTSPRTLPARACRARATRWQAA